MNNLSNKEKRQLQEELQNEIHAHVDKVYFSEEPGRWYFNVHEVYPDEKLKGKKVTVGYTDSFKKRVIAGDWNVDKLTETIEFCEHSTKGKKNPSKIVNIMTVEEILAVDVPNENSKFIDDLRSASDEDKRIAAAILAGKEEDLNDLI